MTDNKEQLDYGDIDEVDEEALLKSDDEYDMLRLKATSKSLVQPSEVDEEDSLINEATQLEVGETVNPDSERSTMGDNRNEGSKADDGQTKENLAGVMDDDDDDDDDDESSKAMAEFKNILSELKTNKYAYDKYIRLCELAHITGELDNIRRAYDLFAEAYPLTSELWLKYIQVEMNIAQSDKEIQKVEDLFRDALDDYYSSDIGMAFAEFAHKTKDPEAIWNEMLGTYGLQCLKGREFFKKYREYLENNSKLSSEEKQSAYIKSYLRELKYPLFGMEDSYIEFKIFYEKNKEQLKDSGIIWEAIDKEYFKAKDHLKIILIYEEELKNLAPKEYRERAEIYKDYMRESDRFLDENIFQTIGERMVADCCLNVDCWMHYIDFVDERDDEFGRPEELQNLPVFQQDAVDISARALRNCTWSEELYIQRIVLLEKRYRPRETVQEVVESAMEAGFQTAEPVVAIWLEYLTYLRRNTDWEDENERTILRKNFDLGWTVLGRQWGVLADSNCEILKFWGRLEYGPLNDPKSGKDLWTSVMESSDNANSSALWIEYINLEKERDLDSARKLFRKALGVADIDNRLAIASAYERFERCSGDFKSLESCIEFLKSCKIFRQAAESQTTRNAKEGKGTKRKAAGNASEGCTNAKKSKRQSNDNKSPDKPLMEAKPGAFKEHENQDIDLTKDHLRIFLSNLDYSLNEDDIRAGLPELQIVDINLIRAANGRSRGFAYLELTSEESVDKALSLDNRKIMGRPLYISSVLRDKEKRQKFKYSAGLEPKTVFLKGLPNDTTKEEIEEIFGRYGPLADVRLVHHKSGKFKNIAYVEYKEEASAGRAVLGTHQMDLRGHILIAAISLPPAKPSTSGESLLNPIKLLGLHKKVKGVNEQQKPRMSLIPTAVRRNLEQKHTVAAKTTESSDSNGTVPSGKTNEDFRKLLTK